MDEINRILKVAVFDIGERQEDIYSLAIQEEERSEGEIC
jgi:hypothetical protein